jgi:hypothetical protein
MCVCMFTYSWRRIKPNGPKLGMFMPWQKEDISERSKLWKSVWVPVLGEGGFCSLETKVDRRMAPRPKLFVSMRRLQKQRPTTPPKKRTVLGSSPDKDGLCSSETKYDKRTAPRKKFFYHWEDYRNKGHNPENQSWVRVLPKMVSITQKLNMTEKECQDQSCLLLRADYKKRGHNPEKCPGFKSR